MILPKRKSLAANSTAKGFLCQKPGTNSRPGAFALLCSLLVFAGCSDSVVPEPPPPVSTVLVQPSKSADSKRYSAVVKPLAEVVLTFKSGGYVSQIATRPGLNDQTRPLEAGDTVKAGETLAAVRQSDYTQKVQQARSKFEQSAAALQHAQSDFERGQRLIATHSITQSQFDGLTAQRDSAKAAFEGAQALLDEAETALDDSVLKAPFAGTILSRNIEEGALVGPSSPAFVLADTRTVKVVLGVTDSIIEQIELGQEVAFQTSTLSSPCIGAISTISPAADPRSRLFPVEILIPNPKGNIYPGSVATIILATDPPSEQIAVPLSAIVRSTEKPDGFSVFVIQAHSDEPIATQRDIETGEIVGNQIEVLSGLKAGDRVVTQGATLLHSGDKVTLLP